MQKREKLLAISLGLVVLLWFGLPIFDSIFVEPLNALTAEEERKQEEANEKFDEQIALRMKEKQLATWRKSSLPPNPLNAQRLYQQWLTDLAVMSGFEETTVTLERRVAQGGVFVTIPVTLEAKATVQELAEFLERFESVDLLHRIATCDSISPSSEGNPDLQVTITAEGLSMSSAPERTRLFPQVELVDGLSKEQTEVTIPGISTEFPNTGGFRVWINDEFADVTEINGNTIKLQRGVGKTTALDHFPGTTLEYFPVVEGSSDITKEVEAMWSLSLFTKPAPLATYDPKLASTAAPAVIRGEKWNWKLNVSSWNPAFGSPMFTLQEGPKGMEIDERSGTLTWDVTSEGALGEHPLEVKVWGSANKQSGFTTTVPVKVRDPNEPPEFEQPGPFRFFLGRTTVKQLGANDPDGENNRLKYSIENAPEGMQLNESEGTLSWTPSEALDEQKLEVRVTVTDSAEDPKSVTQTIPISVEEDSAKYTYLTTTFKKEFESGDPEWEAYLYDRATNETTQLKVNQEITIADFEMNIKEINEDHVEVIRPDGTFRILFERPLVQMVKLSGPTQVSPETPVKAAAHAAAEEQSTAQESLPMSVPEVPEAESTTATE